MMRGLHTHTPHSLSFVLQEGGSKNVDGRNLDPSFSNRIGWLCLNSEKLNLRNSESNPFSVARGSLFIGGRPLRLNRSNLAFRSLSCGRRRDDYVNLSAVIIKAKR